jgi:hypothetical protein
MFHLARSALECGAKHRFERSELVMSHSLQADDIQHAYHQQLKVGLCTGSEGLGKGAWTLLSAVLLRSTPIRVEATGDTSGAAAGGMWPCLPGERRWCVRNGGQECPRSFECPALRLGIEWPLTGLMPRPVSALLGTTRRVSFWSYPHVHPFPLRSKRCFAPHSKALRATWCPEG